MLSLMMVMMTLPSWATTVSTNLEKAKGNSQTFIENSLRRKASNTMRLQAPENTIADVTTNGHTWGILYHENGTTWYYTQTFEERGWYYGASDICIYDNNFNVMGTIRVEIPEDMNVNDIDPIDFVSTTFFDGDVSSVEIPIFMHAVDNGTQIKKIGIYHLDGEKIIEYNSQSMIDFRASADYLRILLMEETAGDVHISVLKGSENGNAPTIEHTFTVDQDLLYYNNGPVINYYSLNNEPYYCISHFEKPCMDGMDMETFVPTQAPNNHLLIKTYDKTFNMVDSLSISIDPTNSNAIYGFASLGMLSFEDVRLGDFTNDNQRNYIVTHYDYFAQSDDFVYYFRVYDQNGEFVKNITEYTTTWFSVSDLKGHEQQMVFLKQDNKGAQILEMVDLPSCEVAAVFPANIDGFQISTTLDRYPNGDDYQYVIGLSQATLDSEGNAIARIGWYNRDCSVDHYATFNLGKNAEGFTPYIATYVLDPYMFNTDSRREYFYLAMTKRTDGTDILDKVLYLADEDGTVLRTIKPEEGDEIEFSSGDIFDFNTPSPKLVLSFYNGEKDAYEIDFYNLPFDKFTSGGEGSIENPYIITTPGELAQMHSCDPMAHYVLGNDIDMSEYMKPYFAPAEFMGDFDGNNHTISHISLDGNGLFGILHHGDVKNLYLQSPLMNIGKEANCAGILAGSAIENNIENVHIFDAVISNDNSNYEYAGGMVGYCNNTTFNAVSFLRGQFVGDVNNFGGIAGIGNCIINAASTSGEDPGSKSGGIIAKLTSFSKVTNSHTHWNVLLPIQFGGIASIVEGTISNCYTTGICYGELDLQDYPVHDYGGIAYQLQNVEGASTVPTIENCVTTSDIIVFNDEVANYILRNNYSENIGGYESSSKYGAYKPNNEWNRAFFESLGYAYGNSYDAPWMCDGIPVLYYENGSHSTPTIENNATTIVFDGNTIIANDAYSIALYDMQGISVAKVNGTTIDTSRLNSGIYIVVAYYENAKSESRKIVIK